MHVERLIKHRMFWQIEFSVNSKDYILLHLFLVMLLLKHKVNTRKKANMTLRNIRTSVASIYSGNTTTAFLHVFR